MALYASLHLDPDEPCEISCSHQLNDLKPEGYPVLAIDALTIYPTRERLERLRAVIDAYLSAHPDKADGPEVGYPSDIWCDNCGNATLAFADHLRCFSCGNSMPLPAGAVADADGLLASMVSIDEARRDSLEGLP